MKENKTMDKNNFSSKFNLSFVLSIIIYSLLYIVLTILYDTYKCGVNTGTIAFITIAQKYIKGDFQNAVVGGFTPLSSWLLIPFLKLGLKPVLALSILKLIVGLLILTSVRVLSYRFEMSETLRGIVSFTVVPIVLHFTLTEHIPDLLIVCSILWYLSIMFNVDYPEKKYKGVLGGIIGGIGYFGKAFMFPFFLSHFLLFNILHYIRTKEKIMVLQNTILGIVTFFVICAPWLFVISQKYNSVTFDTSGVYNRRIIGPEIPRITQYSGWEGWRNYIRMGHPVYDQGFFPPPNETAISIWEDFATLASYLKPWSPFESWDYFKYQLKLIIKNIYFIIGIFEGYFSLFSSAIIVCYLLLYALPFNLSILKNYKLYPLFTILLYCGGYLLVYPTERYLWPNEILILLMGGHVLDELFQSKFFNSTRKNLLTILFILSFIVMPLYQIRDSGADIELYNLGMKLKRYTILNEKNLASNDKFSETLKMLFYSELKVNYYGEAREDISDEDLKNELRKYNIDYYLVWNEPEKTPLFLSNYKKITVDEISGLRIYSLKQAKE